MVVGRGYRLSMPVRRHALCALLTAVLLLSAVPARAGAQEPDPQLPTFRSEVRLVLHSIAVLDASGRPVTDLQLADFVIYEDGAPVTVELFLAPDTAPLDIALVLDTSTSLFAVAGQVRRAAGTFLTRLAPEDCVYLLPFNDRVGPGQWGRAADPNLTRRVDGLFMHGGTALYDALLEAMTVVARAGDDEAAVPVPDETPSPDPDRLPTREELLSGIGPVSRGAARELASPGCGGRTVAADVGPGAPDRRRALVLLTDGADENSRNRFEEVLELARASSVPVFPVVLGEARRDPRLRQVLDTLADSTGGAVIESLDPSGLQSAYDDVVSLLRASYLVGYRPPHSDTPRWRAVEVRSRRPSYRLVHRERYHR